MTDFRIDVTITLVGQTAPVTVTLNVPGVNEAQFNELKDLIMTAKDDLTATLTTVADGLTEVSKDLTRLVGLFNDAIANGDLAAVQDLANQLSASVTAIDNAIEAVAPETPPTP